VSGTEKAVSDARGPFVRLPSSRQSGLALVRSTRRLFWRNAEFLGKKRDARAWEFFFRRTNLGFARIPRAGEGRR